MLGIAGVHDTEPLDVIHRGEAGKDFDIAAIAA